MDNNQLGSMALSFLEAFFEGGVERFTEQGGVLSNVPFDDNTILIYHPDMSDMSDSFIQAIEEHNKKSLVKFTIVNDFNFCDSDPIEAIKQLYEIGEDIRIKFDIPIILYNPLNPLVLVISIPVASLSNEEIQEIAAIFSSKIPGITRGCLIVGDEKYPFSSSGVYEVVKKITLEPDRVNITGDALTEDAITNLKIDLALISNVDDFINMM
jgi:hypothetical protein